MPPVDYASTNSQTKVREKIGFKNVNLGNVANASLPGETHDYIAPDDQALYTKYIWHSII